MVNQELVLLYNYLIVGALLFGIGVVGFLSRRNIILMFLSAEMMLQGVSISLVAWSRYHNDFGGQMLVIFIIAVAACEAAILLALALSLLGHTGWLDTAAWRELREACPTPLLEEAKNETVVEEPVGPVPTWPHLPPAGIEPQVSPEETEYRRHV